jgi:hypothetical protein
MVIRGKTRGNGKQLASYLTRKGENERVQIMDIRGTAFPADIHKSLLEMSLTSELTKSDKGLFHAQLNPAYGDDKQMTREDWLRAAELVEQELGLSGQKRVMVMHEKKGRIHAHVVWERYDHDKGIMREDSYTHYAMGRARKTIEKELNHTQTPERNQDRPTMKRELTQLWRETKTGKEFQEKAAELGYTIAVDRSSHPFNVVNEKGRAFNIVSLIDDKQVKVKQVRERFKDQKLPDKNDIINKIRSQQMDTMQERFIDKKDRLNMQRSADKETKQVMKDKAQDFFDNRKEMTAKETDKERIKREYVEQMKEIRRKQRENKKDKGHDYEPD